MEKDLKHIDENTYKRIWAVIGEIGAQERHFNALQTGYRNMTSAWLLATFAGIGFAISQTMQVAIPREVLVAAIAAAGCVGISLLWVMDLLVYHRLLDSCFIEGLILEERYSWLPRFRHNMMQTQQGSGVLFRTVGFYLAPVVLLILIASGALALWCYHAQRLPLAALVLGAGVIGALCAGAVILAKTENTAALKQRFAMAKNK